MTTGRIKIEGDATEVNKMLKRLNGQFTETEEKGKQAGKGVSMSFTKVAISTAAVTAAFYALDKAITKTGETNAKIESRKISYTWLARQNKELSAAVRNTEQYTMGLMSHRDAIFMVSEAYLKGAKVTGEQYKGLMELSAKLALIQGKSIREVTEGILTGTARQSIAILENSGIFIRATEVVKEYAAKHNLVVDAMSEEQKKMAILNEMIKKGKELTADISLDELKMMTTRTQMYAKYVNKKAELEESFYKKIGNVAEQYYKWSVSEDADAERTKQAERIVALKYYNNVVQSYIKKGYSEEEAIARVAYHKQGTLSANSWTAGWRKHMNEVKGKLEKEAKLEVEAKIKRIKVQHYIRELNKDIKKIKEGLDKNFFLDLFIETDDEKKAKEERKAKSKKAWEDQASLRASWADKIIAVEQSYNKKSFETGEEQLANEDKIEARRQNLGNMSIARLRREYTKALTLQIQANKEKVAIAVKDIEIDKSLAESAKRLNDELKSENLKRVTLDAAIVEHTNKKITRTIELRDKEIQALRDTGKLEEAMQKEIDLMWEYGVLKGMTEEEIQKHIARIRDKYSEQKKKKEFEEVDAFADAQQKAFNIISRGSDIMYQELLQGSEINAKELTAQMLMSAGGQIYADGVKNMWIGGGELVTTGGVKGGETFAYGVGEVAAGVGMGYLGKAMLPSESKESTTKETAASTRAETTDTDRQSSDIVHLYPSEKEWLRQQQYANTQLQRRSRIGRR